MKRSHQLAIVGVILAVTGAVVFLRSPRPLAAPRHSAPVTRHPPAPQRRAALPHDDHAAAPASLPDASAQADRAMPASLEGTEIDGWLGVDDEKHLVVTPGARWFFEYFLSATGEESPQAIRARIVAEIEKRLPEPGAREAIELLDRYLAYRERVRDLAESGAPEDIEERLAQLRDIRRQMLGDANAAVLFGEEEAVQALDLARRNVRQDAALSPEDRQRKLDELEQQLPAPARAARAEAMGPLRLVQEEADLRAAGANPEEVRALRESHFGAEAADRLEALDREEAEWQRRLDEYRLERAHIDADPSLSDADRGHAIAALRSQRFSAEEQLRVEALDHLREAEGQGKKRE